MRDNGLMDDVLTVEELRTGDDKRATDLFGMDPDLLVRALQRLERSGRARSVSADIPVSWFVVTLGLGLGFGFGLGLG